MLRKDRELGREEAMRLLKLAKHGTLCLAADEMGYPYAVPINCALVDGALVFHGAPIGTKIKVLGRDDRASFVAVLSYVGVEARFSADYESVIAKGRVERVEDAEERLRLLRAFTAKVFDVTEASIDERVRQALGATWVLRMSIDELTGKRAPKA